MVRAGRRREPERCRMTAGVPRLAPLYDLLATVVYPATCWRGMRDGEGGDPSMP